MSWFNRRKVNWRVAGWFALGSIPLALLGGYSFAKAPLSALSRLLGALLLLIVVWRHLRPRRPIRFPRPHSRKSAPEQVSFLRFWAALGRSWLDFSLPRPREGRIHRNRGTINCSDARYEVGHISPDRGADAGGSPDRARAGSDHGFSVHGWASASSIACQKECSSESSKQC